MRKNKPLIQVFALSLGIGLLLHGNAIAQNKVVVVPLGESESKIARTGQTLAGQIAVTYAPNSTVAVVPISFPKPLPASTGEPTLEYVFNTTSDNCPGIGSSSPGVLCVYGYFESNLLTITGNVGGDGANRLYGYSFSMVPSDPRSNGFMLASWAYRVP